MNLVFSHPVIGDIFAGDFVALASGDDANPFIAKAVDSVDQDTMAVQWVWRPADLLKQSITGARDISTFASNELVIALSTDSTPKAAIIDKVTVFDFNALLSEEARGRFPHGSYFFYRQMVNDTDTPWELQPEVKPSIALPDGSRIVENPENVYGLCTEKIACKSPFIFAIEPVRIRDFVGDINGYIPFVCPLCSGLPLEGTETSPPGKEWLSSLDPGSILEPQDAKRKQVIDKFASLISSGSNEEEVAFGSPEIVRAFAISLERVIHDITHEKQREYKSKVFTLTFNLSDAKNDSLRRRILMGRFSPHTLATATSEQLASEHREKNLATQVAHHPKRVKIDHPAVHDPVGVEIAAVDLDTPNIPHRSLSVSVDRVEAPYKKTEKPVADVEMETQEPGTQALYQHAQDLKAKLTLLAYASLREFALGLVDHIMRLSRQH